MKAKETASKGAFYGWILLIILVAGLMIFGGCTTQSKSADRYHNANGFTKAKSMHRSISHRNVGKWDISLGKSYGGW